MLKSITTNQIITHRWKVNIILMTFFFVPFFFLFDLLSVNCCNRNQHNFLRPACLPLNTIWCTYETVYHKNQNVYKNANRNACQQCHKKCIIFPPSMPMQMKLQAFALELMSKTIYFCSCVCVCVFKCLPKEWSSALFIIIQAMRQNVNKMTPKNQHTAKKKRRRTSHHLQ